MAEPRITREQRAALDVEKLLADPAFQRFLYTIFESARMFTGTYGTDGRHLAFGEGRRSLGFDILRTIERARPNALVLILAEEQKTQMEAPRGKRKYNRLSELDDDGPQGSEPGRAPGDGLVFLDYPPDAE